MPRRRNVEMAMSVHCAAQFKVDVACGELERFSSTWDVFEGEPYIYRNRVDQSNR